MTGAPSSVTRSVAFALPADAEQAACAAPPGPYDGGRVRKRGLLGMEGIAVAVTGIRTDRVRIAPPPDWVDHSPYPAPLTPPQAFINGGLCTLLNDTQVDLCGPRRAWHVRSAECVVTTTGAERAAQFNVSFNPSFEDLHIHHIRVIRDGVVTDHALPDNFEIFRRERRLERLVLDGRLSVTLITPDVRVGDLIETSYTIYGINPALGGMHTAWIGFEWPAPILDTRHRLRHPSHRTVTTRGFCDPPAEQRTEAGGIVDRRWRAPARVAPDPVELAPPWTPMAAEIQFSEAPDWGAVSAMFAPLYEEQAPPPHDLLGEIEALSQRFTRPADRAVEALRFVQSHIRYLAVSIGEGGYQPRPLAQIWSTRYGDCKDVSRLLTMIAQHLGLDAAPALVNTHVGEGLGAGLPSPTAFNHCIVRLRLDGRTYWMDATGRPQGGDLARLHQPYFGHALPLTGPDAALEAMARPQPSLISDIEEEITLGLHVSDVAVYRWKTTYADWKADSLRDELRNEGEAAIARRYLRQIRDTWPNAEPQEQTRFEDEPTSNRLVVHECYRLPGPWRLRDDRQIEFSSKDYFITPELVRLDLLSRTTPIYLARPRSIARRVRINAPFAKGATTWDRSVDCDAMRFTNSLTTERPGVFVLRQRLDIRSDTMSGADAGVYGRVTDEMGRSDLVFAMLARNDKVVAPGAQSIGSQILSVLGFLAALGAVAVLFVAYAPR
jgi:transglutaminase-like putative cysteine protease